MAKSIMTRVNVHQAGVTSMTAAGPVLMIGCDLHDRSMLLKMAVGLAAADTRSWTNDPGGRAAMIGDLQSRARAAGANRTVFAYEASGLGFTVHDELEAAGIECHVLAPSKMARSLKHRTRKTDERDAEDILAQVRGWVLAGNELPEVWIPDAQTRDDRELVRMRLEVADKLVRCKCQIRCLLKRNKIESSPMARWSKPYVAWLQGQAQTVLRAGAGAALSSLLRQLEHLEQERGLLDREVAKLSKSPRYERPVRAAVKDLSGVGLLTAMVVATEIGDPRRFANRQAVGSFLGLTPQSYETGQSDDRKGHITRQGPGRVRKVLNQAVWAMLRGDPAAQAKYQRIADRNPKHKKKAVVAMMRDLGIRLWHKLLDHWAA